MQKIIPFILLFAFILESCHHSSEKDSFVKPDHVVIVMEENHGFEDIIGSPYAPFINKLADENALMTNSHGVTHPSQPNYIAIYSGELQGVKGDECLEDTIPYVTHNLGAALIKAGYTFKGFAEDMPYDGYRGCYYLKSKITNSSLYGRKHAPWVNWLGFKENQLPDSLSRPVTDFPRDFSKLPTVSFVIPNMDNDMHNHSDDFGDSARIRTADDWVKEHLGDYIKWAKENNSLLIYTFDEDDFTPDNHIPTIFAGAMVRQGKYADSINHYNVLRTIERMYRLTPSGSATEGPIEHIWKAAEQAR